MLVIVASMWGMDEVAIFYVPAAPLEKKSKTEALWSWALQPLCSVP